MTTAVLLATAAADDGRCAALLRLGPVTLLGRLVAQLEQRGVERVHVLTRPAWEERVALACDRAKVEAVGGLGAVLERLADMAHGPGEPLVVALAETVVHDAALANLLSSPRDGSHVLWSQDVGRHRDCPLLRLQRGQVMAAESAYHRVARPNGAFLGALAVAGADRPAAAQAASRLAEACRGALPPGWAEERAGKAAARDGFPAGEAGDDAVSLLLVGLVRCGVTVRSIDLRGLHRARPLGVAAAAEAEAALAAVDEDAEQLRAAVKATDGFFTTFFVSPYSRHLARWAARRGLTPNQVTTLSLGLGVAAAAAFALGTRPGLVAGAVLLQLAFVADCVDGQLARYTRQFSPWGAWLDSVFDRTKEYGAYAGLAVGAVRAGDDGTVWLYAAAALALQLARHFVDFSYAAAVQATATEVVQVPLTQVDERPEGAEERARWRATLGNAAVELPADGRVRRQGAGWSAVRLSAVAERVPGARWGKRILVLPIGERFALISITAALTTPRTTFAALLSWGTVAALYTTVGRVMRSLA